MVDKPHGWSDIDGLVENTFKWNGGGTKFFDLIDENLTHPYFFELLRRNVQTEAAREGAYHPGYLPPIAVSGKFGWAFSLWVKREALVLADLIVFPGDLRHQELPDPMVYGPLAPAYVYLDNSTYKGRTMRQIDRFLRKYRSKLVDKHVLYDGALPEDQKKRDETFHYTYRWHENGLRETYD